MPIYEYRCPQCDTVVEIMHSMSDETPRLCETCSTQLERLISRTSFALKGGGWYKDLYSSPKPDGGKSKSGDSGSDSKSKDAGSSAGSSSTGSDSGSSSGSSSSGSSGSGSSGSTAKKE